MNKGATPPTNLEKIEGVVERVAFHNPENGFTVLRVKAKCFSDLITVVGHVNSASPGENLIALGEWVQTREYGQQLRTTSITLTSPSTLDGIEKYLSSGAIKGIGPHFASKLVKAFGENVFEVIEKEPSKLLQVEKIASKRLEQITTGWKDVSSLREIMVFLQTHGVTTSKAARIYKIYGKNAIDAVKNNPYQLARDIPGIGFKSADLIATNLGIDKKSMVRARAGLSFVLYERVNSGHCAYPRDHLIQEAQQLLEIDESILVQALELELFEKNLIEDEIDTFRCVYPHTLHQIEDAVAEVLSSLQNGTPPWPFLENIDLSLQKTEKQLQLTLAPLQKLAIYTALTNKTCVITGGPGTGKSTLTKALVSYLDQLGLRILLCSPTGRAAKRLGECTGMGAKTIHRMLGYDPVKREFRHNNYNHLEADLVLIDEASMIDVSLAHALLTAIPPHAALVIIGDIDQLPSVGPGQFLTDVIQSQVLPVVTLSQIFRQASESQIIQVAHKINHGEMPDLIPHRHSDFFFLERDTPEEVAETILNLITQRLPNAYDYNPMCDIQVLSPMQKGVVGARNLNLEIQKALNGQPIAKVERFGNSFGVGDKVMVIQNDYEKEVFNGDIGHIETINLEEQFVKVGIENRSFIFDFADLDLLQTAYTITIHKSQGSEYPVVILPLVTQHYSMLQKNLIYTAITRGKKLVIIVGQHKALSIALFSTQKQKRWTKLKERLMTYARMSSNTPL